MRLQDDWRKATLLETRLVADDVRLLTFQLDGPRLPAFEPGSHTRIRVQIKGHPAIRSYTIIPVAGAAGDTLSIAVKKHPVSRGGSDYVWSLQNGDVTEMTLPENRFELSWRAPHALLVAGGIGITPLYGMAKALREHGQSFRLVYGARTRGQMAFLEDMMAEFGSCLAVFAEDEGAKIDLAAEFAALPPGSEIYACGPHGMLEVIRATWVATGQPLSRLRFEVFGDSGRFAEQPFEVHVASLDRRVQVRSDQTLLSALMEAGVAIAYDRQRGECGLCAVEVIEKTGEIDHRDVFLSTAQKQEGQRMCACVSRLASGSATIDIGYRTTFAFN